MGKGVVKNSQKSADILYERPLSVIDHGIFRVVLKVAFFQKVRFVSQISKKNYSKSLSWAWNLNKLFTIMGGNFKFQVQDSDLE